MQSAAREPVAEGAVISDGWAFSELALEAVLLVDSVSFGLAFSALRARARRA